ncbi:MAG TPA: LPXTG cell wall anchor domain-containing protein [Stackebrandtia sp.]|jgi:LPXTG-motif cell wall-anchored protein|uniref:LPXTG cell wall anchor domain-containing protein n=1 Tax=Stackebrandtia sp. TaxID=2023065 RepID=UPI002D2B7095|nr:LPXTG cell wall anchor domain-containing protein [Stackebrandtia sp.]HZE39909.1 LPXTG cell wall anchor domain-containing protein [Stackebrandtia sp.]
MRVSPRTLIAAVAASAAVVIAVPTPALAADALSVDAGLPLTVPGAIDDSSDGVNWVTHLHAPADFDGATQLRLAFSTTKPIEVNLGDDRCNSDGTDIVCALPAGDAAGDQQVEILLRDNWRSDDNGPVHVTATYSAKGLDTVKDSGDITIAPDDRAGRVKFDAPSQIESDQVPGGKGVDMPVTVTNNSSDTLGAITLKLSHAKEEEQDGVILSSHDKGCTGKEDLECTINGLIPGESKTVHVTLYANPDLKVFGEPETISGSINVDSQLWGYHDDETQVVKAKGGDNDVLPITGSSLTLPLAGGAAAIVLGGVLFLVARRRRSVED